MAIDFSGGLDATRDYVLAERPETEGMRDAVNMWIWDDRGEIGLPRVAAEAVAEHWENSEMMLNLTFADGRILRNWDGGSAHAVNGPNGNGSIFGAGPMQFETVEPYRRYRTRFNGTALDTSFDALAWGSADTRRAKVEYEIKCETAAPPWVQGTMSEEARLLLAPDSIEGQFMGGDRFEQLMRVSGRVKIDGVERHFTGGGLRIRRQGVRRFADFWGHCWQSSIFPSGRGFGCNVYPPRPDGGASYNEGYLYLGDGELIPARVVEAPWLHRLDYAGQDLSLVLESRLGLTRITGELIMAAPTVPPPGAAFGVALLQSIARFTWDGETAYGMTERSSLVNLVEGLKDRCSDNV